jgi:hypothetical protein
MAQLNNIRTVTVPSIGKLPLAEKGSTFTPSGTKREHKAGRTASDGGFTATEQPAKLELNINMQSGIDLAAINAIEDEDITIRLSDGQVHMMSLAYAADPLPVGDGEGKITLMSNTSELIA